MNLSTIIVALIGGAGGILAGTLAIVKFIAERKDTKRERSFESLLDGKLAKITGRLDIIDKRLDDLDKHQVVQDTDLHEIHLDTTRTQLYFKMEHDTHNHDTILKIAHKYFVILKGDWVSTADFLAWAEKENVKIPDPILIAIAENDKK